jgi:hypothetical protein
MSICPYISGEFDIFIEDDKGNTLELTGTKRFTKEQMEFAFQVAPPNVMTKYQRVESITA